jgi:hypothetical protein
MYNGMSVGNGYVDEPLTRNPARNKEKMKTEFFDMLLL